MEILFPVPKSNDQTFDGKLHNMVMPMEATAIEYEKVWSGVDDVVEMLKGFVMAEVKRLGVEVIEMRVERGDGRVRCICKIRSMRGIV